jgi:predicted dehydrogenase
MTTRRSFVRTGAVAAAGMILPRALGAFPAGHSEVIRVGLIGCGGRGTGAARDCLKASDGVELVALGDLFPDRLASCKSNLARVATGDPTFAAKYKVTDERCFSGFDAYQRVIDSGVDMVLLATPPAFRPVHFAAAIAASKHVFMEKPVAVDASGVRAVIAASALAQQKKLGVVAGTQRRHDAGYRAVIERIRGGAIGDVVSGQVYWNQGGLWMNQRKSDWTDTEWQLRNWLYFTWLSGDHIVEQHIHNIDVANWVIGSHPIKAVGVGGRQSRTDPAYGHIYDHFAIDFEYPNGVRVLSMCRQIDGSANDVSERFIGTRGRTNAASAIEGPSAWKYDAQNASTKPQFTNPYVQEHFDLVASIRAGTPLNEGKQVAESTLSAIMGREAAYTGQTIVWDELLNAQQDIMPPSVSFGALKVPSVPMPGRTKLERTWAEG